MLQEHVPDLWAHFCELGIESHMFASQWFLTLYTAKFPLYVVFHIIDVFLLKDLDWVFQVAIALLLVCHISGRYFWRFSGREQLASGAVRLPTSNGSQDKNTEITG